MLKKTTSYLLILALTSSCSLASYGSEEAVAGGVGGGLVGGAIGYAIAKKVGGDSTKNVLVNGAIGTAVGLAAGALINERNIKNAKKREIVVREAKLISKNQMDLDKLREGIYDSSSWGGNEIDTWDKRYEGEYKSEPFQGSTKYEHPKP